MDYKLPSSGYEDRMITENFSVLEAEDTVKFVSSRRADVERAGEIIEKYGLHDRCHVYFSPVFGRIEPAEIVGLAIGTRPDCLPPEMVEMLRNLQLSSGKPVWVELGLQTIHEETARRIRRGYELPVFEDAYRKLKENGLEVIVHVILGLPGESREDMLDTVRYLSSLAPTLDGIKLQLLHILKGTELAREYEADPFPLFTLDSYSDLIVDCLKLLPPETVVHRLTGDGPKRLLIAPLWSSDKKRVLNTLSRKIREA
jgi:radical SAM protein (TIGR01212 family)